MPNAIVWFRNDLRLADNPALQAALDHGHVPICVYVHAPDEEAPWQPGAASTKARATWPCQPAISRRMVRSLAC